MSEQINHEDVKTVSTDGVTVERQLVCTDAGIEGTFVVESERDGPVEVRVVDELPEYFPIDEVAFSPGAAPDAGNITPDRVTLTQTVGDDPVRIRYGIVPSEPVAEVRWSAPTVERVDGVDPVDGEPPDASGSVGPVADLSGLFDAAEDDPAADEGTADGDPTKGEVDANDTADVEADASGADDVASDDESASADPADAMTRIEPQNGTPGDAEDATEASADTGEATEAPEDGQTSTNGADDTSVEDVDGAVGDASDGPAEDDPGSAATDGDSASVATGPTAGAGTTGEDAEPTGDEAEETAEVARHFEVRLDQLSARVEKFGAYASALEPLIDDRGTGETALAGIEDDLADLDRRLSAVREEVDSAHEDRERAVANLQDSVGDIDGALDDVEAAVETLETEVDGLDLGLDAAEDDLRDLEGRVDDHDEAIETTADDVADLGSDLTDVDGAVDEVEGDVSTLDDDLGDLQARVDGFESDLEDLTETVEGVESELATLSENVEAIHDELADIHDEVETLHTFRKSLAQISNIEE